MTEKHCVVCKQLVGAGVSPGSARDSVLTWKARTAATATSATIATVTRSSLPRLIEDASECVEPPVWILLEYQLAARRVEVVVPSLVAQPQCVRAQRLLADDALLLGHSSSTIGWCARTSWPLSIMIRRTLPPAVARISLNSFIASMSPMTSPSAT